MGDEKVHWGWRWGSELTVRMMRFPSTRTRYMDRKSLKRRGCWSGSSESPEIPEKRNFETTFWFSASM